MDELDIRFPLQWPVLPSLEQQREDRSMRGRHQQSCWSDACDADAAVISQWGLPPLTMPVIAFFLSRRYSFWILDASAGSNSGLAFGRRRLLRDGGGRWWLLAVLVRPRESRVSTRTAAAVVISSDTRVKPAMSSIAIASNSLTQRR